MQSKIILFVAGFYIQLTFLPTEYVYMQQICLNQIIFVYKGFIVKENNQTIDFTINIMESGHQLHEIRGKQLSSYITLMSKKHSLKELTTYYYVGVSAFSHILNFIVTNLIMKNGGFTLHASASKVGKDECYIFLGPSGAGKSTIVSLLYPHKILADDRIFIRYESGRFFAYQSTFISKSGLFNPSPKRYKIKKMLFLKQASVNRLDVIERKQELLSLILGQIVTEETGQEKKAISNVTNFIHNGPQGLYLSFKKSREVQRIL